MSPVHNAVQSQKPVTSTPAEIQASQQPRPCILFRYHDLRALVRRRDGLLRDSELCFV